MNFNHDELMLCKSCCLKHFKLFFIYWLQMLRSFPIANSHS